VTLLTAALIGAGYIGEVHAGAFDRLPNVRLAAVLDRDAERADRLAAPRGAVVCTDLDALIALHPDLVSICTPTPSHKELTNRLLEAGIHVLCEKPMARSLEDAQAMIDTAARTGSKLMVAHVSRYEADHRKAKDLLDRGDIGALRMGFHAITGSYPGWSAGDWLGSASASGGPIVDLAIHSVDYLMWLFASPVVRVYAVGSGRSGGRDHYALATLTFANGGIGLVETSWAHPPSAPLACRVELSGTRGRVSWDYDQITGMQAFIEGKGRQLFTLEGENGYAAEIADFIHCIEHDLPSPVPGEQARDALQVCLAAAESLHTGQCVEIPTQSGAAEVQ
jgi:predicted dehydrogenase